MASIVETASVLMMLEIVWFLIQLEFGLAKSTGWCPLGRYSNDNGQCKLCFENCGHLGCTGPGSHLGEGGCSSCWLGLEINLSRTECVSPFARCRSGYYRRKTTVNGRQVAMCRKCHSLCGTCSGPGVSYCDTCRFYRYGGMCVRECPAGSVVRRGSRRTCVMLANHSRRRPFRFLPYRDRYRNAV